MRARPDAQTRALTLMSVSPRDLSMTRSESEGISLRRPAVGTGLSSASAVFYADDGRLVARDSKSSEELAPREWYRAKMRGLPMPRADWWAFSGGRAPVESYRVDETA